MITINAKDLNKIISGLNLKASDDIIILQGLNCLAFSDGVNTVHLNANHSYKNIYKANYEGTKTLINKLEGLVNITILADKEENSKLQFKDNSIHLLTLEFKTYYQEEKCENIEPLSVNFASWFYSLKQAAICVDLKHPRFAFRGVSYSLKNNGFIASDANKLIYINSFKSDENIIINKPFVNLISKVWTKTEINKDSFKVELLNNKFIKVTNLDKNIIITSKLIRENFPEVNRIIKKFTNKQEVTIKIDDILKALKLLKTTKNKGLNYIISFEKNKLTIINDEDSNEILKHEISINNNLFKGNIKLKFSLLNAYFTAYKGGFISFFLDGNDKDYNLPLTFSLQKDKEPTVKGIWAPMLDDEKIKGLSVVNVEVKEEVKEELTKGLNVEKLRDIKAHCITLNTDDLRKPEVKPEVKEEVKEEVKPEAKEEAKEEVKPEVKNQLSKKGLKVLTCLKEIKEGLKTKKEKLSLKIDVVNSWIWVTMVTENLNKETRVAVKKLLSKETKKGWFYSDDFNDDYKGKTYFKSLDALKEVKGSISF